MARPGVLDSLGPQQIHELFTGLPIPDPITFVISPHYLNRPNLYPRQATLLKIIFLRDDLFTDYDHAVIDAWEATYAETGEEGICPQIRERIRLLKALGARWFKEVLLVLGRRAGKGHVSALAMAYVLWHYMAKGDPQEHYGVDRDKKLAVLIFAGKRDQAKTNLYADVVNVITGSECYARFINSDQAEKLSIYVPHDFVRLAKMADKGLNSGRDLASLEILPKESTMMAGRGPASCVMAFDEMAHVVAAGSNRSAEEVYCLDVNTRVLLSDLTWIPIKDICIGDKIVGFDEENEPGEQRKLREAVVLGKRATYGAALRLVFDDGSSVVCSPSHRWFRVTEDCASGKWVKAGYTRRQGSAGSATRLQVGDYIRYIADPWEVDVTFEGGWLSGILDGEGFLASPKTSGFRIGIAQNPGAVLDRVKSILEDKGFAYSQWNKHPGRKSTCEYLDVRGIDDCLRLLGQFRPVRLLEKSLGAWEGKAPRGYKKHKKIVSIEELPEQQLIDIETSTHTFIAEGLVSHNSASTPSLDQFGQDAFIIEPSSPYQMTGQFYANYQASIAIDEETGLPDRPNMLMLQLPSWDIYFDWERAPQLPLFPPGFTGDLGEYLDAPPPAFKVLKGAIQTYDDEMVKLEKANPESFAVERRSHFATVVDAYLRKDRIDAMFAPWYGRPAFNGPPQLVMQDSGPLTQTYKGHADPSKSNCNFGLALAHTEWIPKPQHEQIAAIEAATATGGTPAQWMLYDGHVVFDVIKHWQPSDFPDHIVDYDEINEWIFDNIIDPFCPDDFTFDQFNSAQSIQYLKRRTLAAHKPKNIAIYEKTATATHNWNRYEIFKTALNLGRIHAPEYELAQLELQFLQKPPNIDKVVCPTIGPVQTKDVADAMSEVVMGLIGNQIALLRADLGRVRLSAGMQGGTRPTPATTNQQHLADNDPRSAMSLAGRRGRSPWGTTEGANRPRRR